LLAYNNAHPPPTTIPSSMAAFVAFKASLILSLISPTSTSEAPPTLIIPTPPFNFASLSYNFSLSYSEVVSANYSFIYVTLSSTESFPPAPSIIMVSSFEIIAVLHYPK